MKNFFYFSLLIFSITTIHSQSVWKPLGSPTGGSINSIIEKDGFIFTAAGDYWSTGAVYRSSDGGLTWELKINNLPANFTVIDLACNDTYIFTASTGGKVYRSSDYGESWESSSSGITGYVTYTVYTDGSNVYAGTSEGIFKSTNNGSTWSNISSGLEDYVYAIYSVGDYLFAGTSEGVYRSYNGGNFVAVNNGINTQYPYINCFIYNDGKLFAGLYNRVYTSTNFGNSWVNITSGSQDGAYALKVFNNKIYKSNYYGLHYSTNNGGNWTSITSPSIMNHYLNDVYIDDNLILTGEKELRRSEDNGLTWKFSSSGIANVETGPIIKMNEEYFTSSLNVIYKSFDNGLTWRETDTLPVYSQINSFYIYDNYLFAANSGFALRSPDGENWEQLDVIATEFTGFNGYLFATRTPQYIGRIFRSSDLGLTWDEIMTPMQHDVVSIAAFNNELYIGGFNGLYKSNDNGNTWTPVVYSSSEDPQIEKLYVHNNYMLIKENLSSGLYRTSNGTDWQFFQSNLVDGFNSSFFSYGEILFASTYDDGVIVSYNSGENWEKFNEGLPQNSNGGVPYIKSVYANDGKMFASVGRYSIWTVSLESVPVELSSFTAEFINTDVVLKWQTASEINNRGFEIERSKVKGQRSNVEWMTVGFVDGYGTTSENKFYSYSDENLQAGVYSYRLKQIDFDGTFEYSDIVEVEVNNLPQHFALEQNYPNPFNPSTKIVYHLPVEEKVTLKVFNILGKEVAVLVNETRKAGVHEIVFTNNGELSSGVYFYTLKTNSHTATRKFLMLK